MRRFNVDVKDHFDPDTMALYIPRTLWNMFERGEVYYNHELLSETDIIPEEDFIDQNGWYAFVPKEAIERTGMYTLDEDNCYIDEDEYQPLISLDYIKKYWDVEIDELSNGKIKMLIYLD